MTSVANLQIRNGLLTALSPDDLSLLAPHLENRADPATEMIAKKIIELAQCGERDPVRLREHAIRSLSE